MFLEDILEEEHNKPSPTKVIVYGVISCTLTIVLARTGVIILPLLRKDLYQKLIITMVGLAAGTLIGSTMFHLLPKAFSMEEKFQNHEYLQRCFVVGFGLWAFFLIERMSKLFLHHKEREIANRQQEDLSNVVAQNGPIAFVSVRNNDSEKANLKKKEANKDKEQEDDKTLEELYCDKCIDLVKATYTPFYDKYRLQSNELNVIGFQKGRQVCTQAWMVIVEDSFLDFVDGLSIGTAFNDSILTGCSISVGVLLEELPHELGEFAALLNAGLKFREAFLLKFVASCTTYLGLFVGIWLGNVDAAPYVFALASGMFLYIALANMIPELNDAALKSSRTSIRKGIRVLGLQNMGLMIGIAIIFSMTIYEDIIRSF